jgi:hypothetical protein
MKLATPRAAPMRRAWYSAPGVGPAPKLRRRLIDMIPWVGRRKRMRWQAGTVVPRVGPTARMMRRGRAVTSPLRGRMRRVALPLVGAAGVGAAAAVAKRSRGNGASPSGDGAGPA